MNFVEKNTASFKRNIMLMKLKKRAPLLIIGAIFLLLLLGTGIALLLSRTNQEIRQKASEPTGQATVVISDPSTINLVKDVPNKLTLTANTHGVLIYGIQLQFDVLGPIKDAAAINTPLKLSDGYFTPVNTVEPIDGGYRYNFAFIKFQTGQSQNTPDTVSFDTDTVIGEIAFTPSDVGSVSVQFDPDNSLAPRANSAEEVDELYTLVNQTYTVSLAQEEATPTLVAEATATQPPGTTVTDTPVPTVTEVTLPTNTPDPGTPTNTPDAQATATIVPTNTPDPNSGATNTPAPTATIIADNGTGGTTGKSCGQSCSSNAECGINLMCYSGACRLANNPTDLSCAEPPDNGIHRTCNEYCADSRECATGYTCYYNRCRNPKNETDQYCSTPVTYVTTAQTKVITKVVTASPTVTPEEKGGDFTQPTVTLFPTTELFPTNTPFVIAAQETLQPVATVTPEEEMTMVEKVQGWLKGLLIIALAISAIFLILWLLPLLLGRRRDDEDNTPRPPMTPPTMSSGMGQTPSQPGSYPPNPPTGGTPTQFS